jgi:mannosyl-oligosaccharide alpha-1,2-mannosidase
MVLAEYLENTAKAAAESEALKISDEKETIEIKAQALEPPEDTTSTEKIAKRTPPTSSYDEKVISTEAELRNNPPGRQSPIRLKNEILTLDDPIRPLSHKEYVADRIKTGRLPTGMVAIRSKAYILRYLLPVT